MSGQADALASLGVLVVDYEADVRATCPQCRLRFAVASHVRDAITSVQRT